MIMIEWVKVSARICYWKMNQVELKERGQRIPVTLDQSYLLVPISFT